MSKENNKQNIMYICYNVNYLSLNDYKITCEKMIIKPYNQKNETRTITEKHSWGGIYNSFLPGKQNQKKNPQRHRGNGSLW
jgi:hypothetical protein